MQISDLKIGMNFASIHFSGEIHILKIDVDNNILYVRIRDSWEEEWNLEHMIWGFNRKEYYLL